MEALCVHKNDKLNCSLLIILSAMTCSLRFHVWCGFVHVCAYVCHQQLCLYCSLSACTHRTTMMMMTNWNLWLITVNREMPCPCVFWLVRWIIHAYEHAINFGKAPSQSPLRTQLFAFADKTANRNTKKRKIHKEFLSRHGFFVYVFNSIRTAFQRKGVHCIL